MLVDPARAGPPARPPAPLEKLRKIASRSKNGNPPYLRAKIEIAVQDPAQKKANFCEKVHEIWSASEITLSMSASDVRP